MTNEMIERVGERLRKECLEVFGATWSYDVAWRFARAAIEEMREPTEEMIDARFKVLGKGGRAEWDAMFDAALKEQEKAG